MRTLPLPSHTQSALMTGTLPEKKKEEKRKKHSQNLEDRNYIVSQDANEMISIGHSEKKKT